MRVPTRTMAVASRAVTPVSRWTRRSGVRTPRRWARPSPPRSRRERWAISAATVAAAVSTRRRISASARCSSITSSSPRLSTSGGSNARATSTSDVRHAFESDMREFSRSIEHQSRGRAILVESFSRAQPGEERLTRPRPRPELRPPRPHRAARGRRGSMGRASSSLGSPAAPSRCSSPPATARYRPRPSAADRGRAPQRGRGRTPVGLPPMRRQRGVSP